MALSAKQAPRLNDFLITSNRYRILLYMFNAVLRPMFYSIGWKIAIVATMPKPGKDPSQIETCRLTSLLPIMSKLFEKLLMAGLTAVVLRDKIINLAS